MRRFETGNFRTVRNLPTDAVGARNRQTVVRYRARHAALPKISERREPHRVIRRALIAATAMSTAAALPAWDNAVGRHRVAHFSSLRWVVWR